MSDQRMGTSAAAAPDGNPRGPDGRRLCRWCGVEVPRGRVTFCSEPCIHEWKLRSDPGYLRDQVKQRDRGICAGCGVRPGAWSDHYSIAGAMAKVQRDLDIARGADEDAADAAMRARCARARDLWDELFGVLRALGYVDGRGHWWEADHVLEVVEGGGECALDNIQTLCLRCHKAKTARLARRRAEAARIARGLAKSRRRQVKIPGTE